MSDRLRLSVYHFTRGYIGAALYCAGLLDGPDHAYASGAIDDTTLAVLSGYAETYADANLDELEECAALHPLEQMAPLGFERPEGHRPMLTSWTLGMVLRGCASPTNGFKVCDIEHDLCLALDAAAPPTDYWLRGGANCFAILGDGPVSVDNPAWMNYGGRRRQRDLFTPGMEGRR